MREDGRVQSSRNKSQYLYDVAGSLPRRYDSWHVRNTWSYRSYDDMTRTSETTVDVFDVASRSRVFSFPVLLSRLVGLLLETCCMKPCSSNNISSLISSKLWSKPGMLKSPHRTRRHRYYPTCAIGHFYQEDGFGTRRYWQERCGWNRTSGFLTAAGRRLNETTTCAVERTNRMHR